MREGLSAGRLWLAFVLLAFCLPLFIGLGGADLETDEAIYSFAVDRILEVGDWLAPKLSPTEDNVFLEKPPLKFWIVAAPIKAGFLPHDEFGMRFWDAVAAGAAFLYTFAIGAMLAGPICGAVAVLVLFLHEPFVFDHGIRTNNMEALLILSYCGGVYHFLRWTRDESCGRIHAVAVGVCFALGFLVKFVAVLFLPLVLGIAAIAVPSYRAKTMRDRWVWGGAALLALALIVPWFAYAQWRFGNGVWEVMFGTHVLQRFAGTLVAEHRQPWFYYLALMYQWFAFAGAAWLVFAGFLTLLVQTIRRRSPEGVVILLWALVPLAAISAGTSKLYHYAYPFLPPLAIAAGYLVALIMMLAPAPLRRLFEAVEDALARAIPSARAFAARPGVQRAAGAIFWVATALAVWVIVVGPVRLSIGATSLFKSSGVVRPLIVITVAALAARRAARAASTIAAIVLLVVAPVRAYATVYPRLVEQRHPLRSLSECVLHVEAEQSSHGRPPVGLYVDTEQSFWHPIYYYFRRIRPWTRATAPSPEAIGHMLHDPGAARPMLVSDVRYAEYAGGPLAATLAHGMKPPMVELLEYKLLLPGPYAACSSDALPPSAR